MKISYIHGICVRNDAISNSIRNEIGWLSKDKDNNICLYGYVCDHTDLPFKQVHDLKDVVFDQNFQSSDLVVFHFGIFYPLFDLLVVTPKKAKRLVVFHNITPKQFVPAKNHPTIDRSFKQMANIVFADHVICVSQTNLDVLRAAGINTPASVLPLAVHGDLHAPTRKPSAIDDLVRLLFIGRFVRSKGPGELLEALHPLLANKSAPLSLDMVVKSSFSDAALIEEVRSFIEVLHRSHRDRVKITIHSDATDDVKNQLLRDADLFILPTYHEGFCVTIVEALASGCKVITYDNSNMPAISGGLARLTATGDIAALSCAIDETIKEVTSSSWKKNGLDGYAEYARRTQKYRQKYLPEQAERRFLNFINPFVRGCLPPRAVRFSEL